MSAERLALVLNAGSSSLKFAVHREHDTTAVISGQIGGIGEKACLFIDRQRVEGAVPPDAQHGDAFECVIAALSERDYGAAQFHAFGHRIVHGGELYSHPVIVNDEAEGHLEGLLPLAPLHMPAGLTVLKRARRLVPKVPQIACFDTAFHRSQPDEAVRLPLPATYRDRGYRRYGFHGLSYEHLVRELLRIAGHLPRRLLAAHLGQGASMCAIRDGKSIATTMGYSTADGLVMGTRTGSIDPGVLVALIRDDRMSADEIEDLIYRRSGLLGLSGISGDMRTLIESGKPQARQAIEHYCYWAARHAGSLAVALEGLDAIVFTGGIGENAAAIRAGILDRLSWLGIDYDPARNGRNESMLSLAETGCAAYIVAANEELAIARQVFTLTD